MTDLRLLSFYAIMVEQIIDNIDSIQRSPNSQVSQQNKDTEIKRCKVSAYRVILAVSSALEPIVNVPAYDSKKLFSELFDKNLISNLNKKVPKLKTLLEKLDTFEKSVDVSQLISQKAVFPDAKKNAEVFDATLLIQSKTTEDAINNGNPQEKGFMYYLNDAWEWLKSLFSCGRNEPL